MPRGIIPRSTRTIGEQPNKEHTAERREGHHEARWEPIPRNTRGHEVYRFNMDRPDGCSPRSSAYILHTWGKSDVDHAQKFDSGGSSSPSLGTTFPAPGAFPQKRVSSAGHLLGRETPWSVKCGVTEPKSSRTSATNLKTKNVPACYPRSSREKRLTSVAKVIGRPCSGNSRAPSDRIPGNSASMELTAEMTYESAVHGAGALVSPYT